MHAVIAVLLLVCTAAGTQASESTTVVLDRSVKAVAEMPATGAANPRVAYISRDTLTSSESSASMPIEVALKMRNFAELQARVNSGERVSPQEMAATYEPLPSDYQAALDWLTSQGLTITRRDPHHIVIFAIGTVSKIQQATKAKFARVSLNGTEYTSAVTAPSVPASLASALIGINGLQPHLMRHKHLRHPEAGSGNTAYSPSQIAQAYQAIGLYNLNINGAGQTIAIVIDTFPSTGDLITFWQTFGINQSISNIQFVQANPIAPPAVSLPVPSGEETLDVEWSSSIAPGAKVRVYAATDLGDVDLDNAYQQVLEDTQNHPELGLHQMSMSFGSGEFETTQSQILTDDNFFVQLTNAGVTCFASSGDNGSTPGIDAQGNEDENGTRLEPESPASDPNVIGVGGTSLTNFSSPSSTNETVWNNDIGASGGGTSLFFGHQTGQAGAGNRMVPDIALTADPNFGANTTYAGSTVVSGGTSWSSPTCAGFCALINQARANVGLPSVGALGPQLYAASASNFRDITVGNNATPKSIQSFGSKYSAATGYDETTGLGVPLVLPLAQTLAHTTNLIGIKPPPPQVTLVPGQNATFTVAASGSPVSYQWQHRPVGTPNYTNLTDNSIYSGSATATLTVTSATAAMTGDQFQCVVNYSTTSLTSTPPSVLSVETPWTISTLAGNSSSAGFVNNPGTTAKFDYPTGIAVDPSGNLYVADLDNNTIREVTPAGVVSTPFTAVFNAPRDIAYDSFSNSLYVADEGSNHIIKISLPSGSATNVGTSTTFAEPRGVAVDTSGNVYVTDSDNNLIRKIAANGTTVTNLAGSSSFQPGFKDGTGTQALFNQPIGLAVDTSGNVYVADYGNEVIRKITPAGVVTTIAGQPAVPGVFSTSTPGHNGAAGYLDGTGTAAYFNLPRGIAVDSTGNLYVTDSYAPIVQPPPAFSGNNLIRKITPAGIVTTLAGLAGVAGSTDATGATAEFYNPCGIAVFNGKLYIGDAGNNTIRVATQPAVVSISATIPFASNNGPVTGQFTVTRTGDTTNSLIVNYATSGTAIPGTDYTVIPASVTIPAGAASATITVIPRVNNQATGNPTVQLTLTGTNGGSGVLLGATTATVAISEAQSINFGQWETNNSFNGASSATPLNDGLPNLLKYFFDINPNQPITASDRLALPTVGLTTMGATRYLTLTYREYGSETDLTISVQTSSDLLTWAVAPNTTITQTGFDPTTGDPIMQAQVPYNDPKQFIRLNVVGP